MFHEKDFEDILSKYPELIEDGLIFKGRQITIYGRRMDLLFEDRFRRKLIVELKKGPIKDENIGQVLSYEGMLLSADDPTIRVMLIGNRVPPNIQRSLDHHGIAWRELSCTRLTEFLTEKNDQDLLGVFEDPEVNLYPGIPRNKVVQPPLIIQERVLTPDEIISGIKEEEEYQSLRNILPQKIDNEEKARNIILQNLGYLSHENMREIITLLDGPYPYKKNGKIYSNPWFGRLLNSNTGSLFETELNKINNWFNTLTNPHLSIEKKFGLLLNEPYNISGLNVGFLTLMLYLLDKSNYSIWFGGLHDGYRKIFPDETNYNGKVEQYLAFNKASKELAAKYGFDHTELDWIYSTGVYLDNKINNNRTQKPLTILQAEYLDFFKLVSEKYKFLTGIFPGKLFPKHYLQIPVGISGIHFEWTFHGRPRSGLGVGLHFEGKKENNQRAIRYLKSREEQICSATGESFSFQEVWGTKWSRIYIERNEPLLTHELADWAVYTMIKFQRVLEPLLKEYHYNRKSDIA
jgi:hypothetical protein